MAEYSHTNRQNKRLPALDNLLYIKYVFPDYPKYDLSTELRVDWRSLRIAFSLI